MTMLGTVLSYLRDLDADEAAFASLRVAPGNADALRMHPASERAAGRAESACVAPAHRTASQAAMRMAHPG
jgi:hypothetical protein